MCTKRDIRTRVIVRGAAGRMGSRVCALALADETIELAGAVEHADSARIGSRVTGDDGDGVVIENADSIGSLADVVIDFSAADAVDGAMELARRAGAALLMGTTGLSASALDRLRALSAERAVLVAPNTSPGVTVVNMLVAEAAKKLGRGYEVSIVEAHHSAKKDAPSGTAAALRRSVEGAGGMIRADQVLSIRGGDVIGEHTVRFASAGEYVEITHRATSRDLFARGALEASKWLARQPAGLYSMRDVLKIEA